MALTLRLEESELQTLERIKQTLGVSTASAAIKQMISSYEDRENRISSLLKAYNHASDEASELKRHMASYFQSQAALARLVTPE